MDNYKPPENSDLPEVEESISTEEIPDEGRRDFLKLFAVATATAVLNTTGCTKEKSKPTIISKEAKEIVDESKKHLDERYSKLRKQVKSTGGQYKIGQFGKGEYREVRNKNVYMDAQFRMIQHHHQRSLKDALANTNRSIHWGSPRSRRAFVKSCRRNRKCWRAVQDSHEEWKDKEINKGKLIKLKANDKSKPYYCQQVGGNPGGTNNREYAMYMVNDMEPVLEALVPLVNHQIDMVNANPKTYGYSSRLKIEHIDAVKISGAFRTYTAQYGKGGSRTRTSDLSAHLTGRAIDLGALEPARNPKSSIVRFENGKTLKAGDRDNPRRYIISKMIARALLSMKKPLANKGIDSKLLWESRPKNWHFVIGPKK